MAVNMSDLMKQYGSVSAALQSQGYSKDSDGVWRKGSSSSPAVSSTGTGAAGGTASRPASSGGTSGGGTVYSGGSAYTGYTENIAADAGLSQAQRDQIQSYRDQAKAGQITWDQANAAANQIRSQAGGYTVDKTGAVTSGSGSWTPSGGYTENIAADAGLSQDILDQIQSYRDQAKAGLITWDQANAAANALRASAGGYTVDKQGNQTWLQPPEVEVPSFEEFLAQMGYDQISDATQQRIQAAVQQAVGNYNAQIEETNKDSDELARQAYIAKMLGQKNLDQQLSAAGYAGGMADSQRIQTETNYENNLQDIENQRLQVVSELERAIRDAQLTGDIQAAQELQAYLQTMQQSWLSYVQSQQQLQNSNYWNQRQMQASDALTQQQISAEQRDAASDRAMYLLSMGIMPGSDVLTQAGLSQQEASAIRDFALRELNGTTGTAGTAGGSSSSSSSKSSSAKRSSSSGGGYDNGGLTTDQVARMQRYFGTTADGLWGSNSKAAAGGLTAQEAWDIYQQENSVSTYDGLRVPAKSLLFSIQSSMRNSGSSGLTAQQKANLDNSLINNTINQAEYNYILNTLGY